MPKRESSLTRGRADHFDKELDKQLTSWIQLTEASRVHTENA